MTTVEQMGLMKANHIVFLLLPATQPAAGRRCPAHSGFLGRPSCPSSFVQGCSAQLRPRLAGCSTTLGAAYLQHLHMEPPVTPFSPLKGGPANWWDHMHFQHHTKPHCFHKDPDMHPFFFAWGKTPSVEPGERKNKYMPHHHQHRHFPLVGSQPCCLSPPCGTFSTLLPSR